MHNEEQLGTATGFIVRRNNRAYLITNWHVVSGRDPHSGQTKHRYGAEPTRLIIRYASFDVRNAAAIPQAVNKEIQLYEDGGRPK